ncbi:MAG: hypothetical protein HY647_08125 [Acidobacteria bacterium]|nr:hypothetical protein [Acidobacteriota bacterium]
MTMTKPADEPDGSPTETSASTSWCGTDPTVRLFKRTIQATKSFAGRQTFESPNNASDFDNCYDASLAPDYGPFHLTGGGWFVGYNPFGNTYGDDAVGPGYARVDYYRDKGRAPCDIAVGQKMNLYTQFISSSQFSFQEYKQNVLELSIGLSTVTVKRDDQPVTRNWGITTDPLLLPTATVGIPYSYPMDAAMDTAPYTWDVYSGTLPPGLTISPSGVISGTPTGLGGFNSFKLRVFDARNFYSTRGYSITVLPPRSLPGQLTSE